MIGCPLNCFSIFTKLHFCPIKLECFPGHPLEIFQVNVEIHLKAVHWLVERSESRSGPRHGNGQRDSGDPPRDTGSSLGNNVSQHTGYNGTQYLRPQVN